jgi:hypothetical protein
MPQIASGPVRAGAKATRLVVGARATSVLGGGGSVTPAKRNACDSGGSCCAIDRKRRKSNDGCTIDHSTPSDGDDEGDVVEVVEEMVGKDSDFAAERSDDKTDARESIQHTEPDDGSCSDVPETEFGTDGEEDRRTRATSGRRRWR